MLLLLQRQQSTEWEGCYFCYRDNSQLTGKEVTPDRDNSQLSGKDVTPARDNSQLSGKDVTLYGQQWGGGGGEGARPLALSHPLPKRNPFLPHPKYSSTACVIGVAYHTGTCRTVKKNSLERLQDQYCTVQIVKQKKRKNVAKQI